MPGIFRIDRSGRYPPPTKIPDEPQFRFGQYILLRHWTELKEYANRRGVRLLGDLPIFVSPDSSDVWANPELFLLDSHSRPTVVAGVPPDYFSADGQLWGNPIYDWDAHRERGFRWWIDRLQSRLDYLDAIRIDHWMHRILPKINRYRRAIWSVDNAPIVVTISKEPSPAFVVHPGF